MKKISIVTPCYNEEENVEILYEAVKKQFDALPQYQYEHLFIDNHSTDKTVSILKEIAQKDKHVKIIVNARNFGPVRSAFYGLRQAYGDAVMFIVADLQDPPELIPALLQKWENGYKIVTAVKNKSRENPLMFGIRKIYYRMLATLSETEQIQNFTGFGLYDKSFVDIMRNIDDSIPYFRGLVSEIGYERAEIKYVQPKRLHGKSKLNFYILYDVAVSGFVNHSKIPLRLASFIGFGVAIISLLVALAYFVYKLVYWNNFSLGVAPLVIGLFFFASIQLISIGIIGEYVGAIFTQVKKRPYVIEKERINFEE